MDRRQTTGERRDKGPKLLEERQSGLGFGRDKAVIDTEDKRRKPKGAAAVAEAPVAAPPLTPVSRKRGPQVTGGPDRWHKRAYQYITVSKDHSQLGDDTDPVSAASAFSSVQEAINFAESSIIPLLDEPLSQRVIIEIHGGDYEENLVIPADCIDLQGIGFPRLIGRHAVVPGTHGPTNRLNLIDLEMYNDAYDVTLFPALTIPPLSDYPAAPAIEIRIDRCFLHGYGGGLESRGSRLTAHRSRFYTDFATTDYDNIDMPAVRIWQHLRGYTVFDGECEIRGLVDQRAAAGAVGFPNVGLALQVGLLYPAGFFALWPSTGVMIRRSSVTGYVINQGWNLIFAHCDLYGGKKHATAGDVFSFVQGDSTSGVHGAITFDHCGISCRYLVEVSDNTTPPANGITDVYIQHSKQLSYGGMAAGSTVESGVVFGTLGFAPTYGNVYVEHSATWRDLWDFIPGAPPNEGAVIFTSNPDIALAIAALPAAAVPSDFRQSGA